MLKIIDTSERISSRNGVKMVILGPFGIGKTTLLTTLDQPTLCIDLEAGLLAVQDWTGDSIDIQTWDDARDLACLLGGPKLSLPSSHAYSGTHYQYVLSKYKNLDLSSKYQVVFIDSLTVASRLCLQWCSSQPESISERSGKVDVRKVYGTLAKEMISWILQFQHIPDKDIIFVGLLEKKLTNTNDFYWQPQCEGVKTASEFPGIVDEVISMVSFKAEDGNLKRVFVCHTLNEWCYPAKDRSGRLDLLEEPHLGKLLKKIKQ